jgi:hypothetical protein
VGAVAAGFTTNVTFWVAVPLAFMADTVNGKLPVIVGVPLSWPLAPEVPKMRPGGSVPVVDQVVMAWDAEKLCVYATLIVADAGAALVMAGALVTSIVYVEETALGFVPLAAVTAKVNVPVAVGVPLSNPPVERVMPVGNAPDETVQVMGAVPDAVNV